VPPLVLLVLWALSFCLSLAITSSSCVETVRGKQCLLLR
jgi:hypothetical protein